MKRPNNSGKRVVPQAGGEVFHEGEPAPLTYSMPLPPVKSRGRLVSIEDPPLIDNGEPLTGDELKARRAEFGIPASDRPLVPTAAEVAALPAKARAAFGARCAERVAPLALNVLDAPSAANLLLAVATVASPVRAWLRCMRRDFDRLVFLAKRDKWTDDTPVPPDTFGPMWPRNLTPEWAKQPPSLDANPPSAPSAD
jgi:hypothetical protein